MRPLLAFALFVCLGCTVPGDAATLPVSAGGDLQAALRAAQPGDTVVLDAGAIFPGHFTLPAKPAGPVITVRTSATLPARRITPDDAALLPTLAPTGVEPVIACAGSQNWTFDGIRLASNPLGYYDLVGIDGCDAITFDRILLVAGPNGQKRGIRANGTHITLTRSHLANVWAPGQDSQAFCAWNGAGPFTLIDNYLEAAGENVMFGGAASASAADIPADILVERNTFTKPLAWKDPAHPASVKNLFELKAAKRVIVRDNLFEHNWTKSQNGYAILFTVRNDDGANDTGNASLGAPWTVVEDVLFERNILRDVENGFNLLGYDSYGASGRTTRITIRHNVVRTAGTFIQAGGEVGTVTVDHNTVENGYRFLYLYYGGVWPVGGPSRAAAFAIEDLTVTNTLGYHNDYGVMGEGASIGTPSLTALTTASRWTHNALAGVYGYPYPDVTWRPTVEQHRAEFTPELALTATSTYRNSGTDGSNLGATVAPVGTPPTPDPCVVDPLVLTVSKWPTQNTGSRTLTYNTGGKRLTAITFTWRNTVTATDDRGCTATRTR
jgi:hypothetical protein